MPEYAHDAVMPLKESKQTKKRQIADMFNDIAFRYDFLNRLLSLGIDKQWRKKAIAVLKPFHPKIVLDIATGTGDFAMMTYRLLKPKTIIGVDISKVMLAIGQEKISGAGLDKTIHLEEGDSEYLRFSDNHFDAVTAAFGVRNFENLEIGLKEMHRVLKPNGKLIVLEFSKPTNPFIRFFYTPYMRWITPKIGGWLAKNKTAYSYLNGSIQAFPEGKTFLNILNSIGFENSFLKPLSFGICTVYCGTKK